MKTSRKMITKGVVTTMLSLGMMFTLAVLMPGSGLKAKASGSPVEYVDRSWDDENKVVVETTKTCSSYTIVTDQTDWNNTAPNSGWYVVSGFQAINTRVTVSGTVNLILCDEAQLTASKGITVESGNTFNIFGQSGQTGKLLVDAVDENNAGIGSTGSQESGYITINGGMITATGGDLGAGIGSGGGRDVVGDITINGGTVTATGGKIGAGIGSGATGNAICSITINGGTVKATGGEHDGAGIGGSGFQQNELLDICIKGGTVTAKGGGYSAGIGGGMECKGGTVTIIGGTVTATGGDNGAGIGGGENGGGAEVVIAGGTVTATGGDNGAGIGGGENGEGGEVTITGGTVTASGGTGAVGIGAGNGGTDHGTLNLGAHIALIGGDDAGSAEPLLDQEHEHHTEQLSYSGDREQYMKTFASIPYMTWDEEQEKLVLTNTGYAECPILPRDAYIFNLGEDGKVSWYVLNSVQTFFNRITVMGTVNLILCDGKAMYAQKGITVNGGSTLNIFGQSGGTGTLEAGQNGETDEYCAGIGCGQSQSCGTITINGVNVEAKGGTGGAGIGGGYAVAGGTITITGGVVTAEGGSYNNLFSGAGIGGGYAGAGGTITITGGTVTANGGRSATGIGAGEGAQDQGDLKLGTGVVAYAYANNLNGIETWRNALSTEDLDDDGMRKVTGTRQRFMKVTTPRINGVSLNETTLTIVKGDDPSVLTATIQSDNDNDKAVKWTVTQVGDEDPIALYTDEDCNTTVTASITDTFSVYTKPLAPGSATITATAINGDSASCTVAVKQRSAVTVKDGDGGGNYLDGATVTITAKAAPEGKLFDKWTTTDGVTFADANAASTTFVMPVKPVTVTANYKDMETVATPVFSPEEGTFTAAQSVAITCATEGAEIHYTTDGTAPTKDSKKYTAAIAVAETVTIKAIAVKKDMYDSAVAEATYTIKPATYTVTVTDGTGGGDYEAGATVTIKANDPAEGKEFDKWTTSDGVTFADASAASTTFTMPAKAVSVTATYKDKSDPNNQDDPNNPDPKPAPVSVASISLDITDASITLKKGDTKTLIAKILPENASNKGVDWSVTDTSIATVSNGTVTAVEKGKTTVTATTKDGGFTASCEILVVDPEMSEEILKEILPDEKYEQGYTPAEETKKEDVPLNDIPKAKIDGEDVPVPVTVTYQPAVSYTGKSIKGEQLVEKFDKTSIISGLTLKDGAKITDPLKLIDIKYTNKSNKNAGKKDAAYFTAKITINKNAKKSLSAKDYKVLQKKVAAVNKELKKKANRYKYTINKRSVTDGKLIVSVKKNADKSIKTKKKGDGIYKVNSIKLETVDPFDPTKTLTIKLPAKNYKIEVVDAKTGLVKVTGKKNFTGQATVYVK